MSADWLASKYPAGAWAVVVREIENETIEFMAERAKTWAMSNAVGCSLEQANALRDYLLVYIRSKP